MGNIKNVMPPWLLLSGAVLTSLALKACLVATERVPFNSDEAVVALMARHILQGERPVFFYGQAYMGSLDAWLVAAGFWMLGEQVWAIRLVQMLLYAGTLLTTAWLGKLLLGSTQTAVLAAWLMAIPSLNVTLYTTASLGGYGEALLLGNLLLGLSWIVANRSLPWTIQGLLGVAWGAAAGLGVWAFGLSLVYSIPAGAYILGKLWHQYRHQQTGGQAAHILVPMAGIAVGVLAGASPWLWYASQNGLRQLLWELSGGAISGVEGLKYGAQIGQHLLNLVLLGGTVTLGLRPPWGVIWLGLPLIPLVILFWGWVAGFSLEEVRRKSPQHESILLLLLVPVLTAAGFVLSPFGADPSGRYFLPMAVPMSLLAANAIHSVAARAPGSVNTCARIGAYSLLILICGYHLVGILQGLSRFPPGITTQFNPITQIDQRQLNTLAIFLSEHGERRGYTNYWVAYPLAFESREELIFTPELPYHLDFRYTTRDNRYAAYSEVVEKSKKTAYITTHHPPLEDYLRLQFERLDVTWSEIQIGDFRVFYALSSAVHAKDIGLGVTTDGQTVQAP